MKLKSGPMRAATKRKGGDGKTKRRSGPKGEMTSLKPPVRPTAVRGTISLPTREVELFHPWEAEGK